METETKLCKYELWSRETGTIESCGMPSDDTELCSEHLAFVKDSTGPFPHLKNHPAKWNWTKKARKAYGIKGWTNGPFPLGIPSDAGANYVYGKRIGKAPAYTELSGDAGRGSIMVPIMERPLPVELAEPHAGEITLPMIEKACLKLLDNVSAYKGKGISPILWGTAIWRVSKGIAPSEKQVNAIRGMVAKQPKKYLPIFAA